MTTCFFVLITTYHITSLFMEGRDEAGSTEEQQQELYRKTGS